MSQKALKVVAELHIRAVTCPGVHLAAKDDIYLSVCVLNQFRKSDCLPAVFPLLFQMKMWFEKTFKYATDPAAIAEILQSETVKLDLIQLIPPVGKVLASYEENTRSFLFPEPKLVPSFSGGDREVLMTRDPLFPGISPRLEFSTRTTISESLERDVFQRIPVRVMTRKRGRKARQHSCSTSVWQKTQAPRTRSLSPFKRSSRTSSSSETPHRPLPNDSSSSDTDDLLDDAEELGQSLPLTGYEGSPSPTLSHLSMTNQQNNSSLLRSSNTWEEVQERVRSLLTSPRAMHRLTFGATESEIDEVLARTSISPH